MSELTKLETYLDEIINELGIDPYFDTVEEKSEFLDKYLDLNQLSLFDLEGRN